MYQLLHSVLLFEVLLIVEMSCPVLLVVEGDRGLRRGVVALLAQEVAVGVAGVRGGALGAVSGGEGWRGRGRVGRGGGRGGRVFPVLAVHVARVRRALLLLFPLGATVLEPNLPNKKKRK